MRDLEQTFIQEVMVTNIVTVHQSMKMTDLAKLFDQHDINAAPVVDESGCCQGIITSHDLVEFESKRPEFMKELAKGSVYGVKNLPTTKGMPRFKLPGLHIDEVGFHMSSNLHPVAANDLVFEVAREMCRKHLHHVVVLSNEGRPIGFLSSLDIVGFIINEPVCRSSTCPVTK